MELLLKPVGEFRLLVLKRELRAEFTREVLLKSTGELLLELAREFLREFLVVFGL